MNKRPSIQEMIALSVRIVLLAGLAGTVMLYLTNAAPPIEGSPDVVADIRNERTTTASISMDGPTQVVPGKVYTYTISYANLTDTTAIRYYKPAPNMSPFQDPDNAWIRVLNTEPALPVGAVGNYDPVYVWAFGRLGSTGAIRIVVEYQACGRFAQHVELVDIYESLPVEAFTLAVNARCTTYMPEIFKSYPTPVPTPTPIPLASTWSAVGPGNLNAAAIAWTGTQQLHIGDSTGASLTGGVYRGFIDFCSGTENVVLDRLRNDIRVLDLSFGSDGNGILGTFDGRTAFYSATDRTWRMTNTSISPVVYSVLYVSSSRAYAGGENGLYQSDDGGSTWRLIGGPKQIDALKLTTDGNVLWLGTLGAGIWNHPINTSAFNPVNTGLQTNGLLVRDIDIHDATGVVYIGTHDGVFRLIDDVWYGLGLYSTQIQAIEIVNDAIYVGGKETGVLQTSVHNPNTWSAILGDIPSSPGDFIRDIDFVAELCRGQGGLIAGTNRGVWVYPLPR